MFWVKVFDAESCLPSGLRFDEDCLNRCVASFQRGDGVDRITDESGDTDLGRICALKVEGNALMALCELNQAAEAMVRQGEYRFMSITIEPTEHRFYGAELLRIPPGWQL